MKTIDPDKKTNWKSGKVHEPSQLKYEEYIQTLKEKYLNEDCSKSVTATSKQNLCSHKPNSENTVAEISEPEIIKNGLNENKGNLL